MLLRDATVRRGRRLADVALVEPDGLDPVAHQAMALRDVVEKARVLLRQVRLLELLKSVGIFFELEVRVTMLEVLARLFGAWLSCARGAHCDEQGREQHDTCPDAVSSLFAILRSGGPGSQRLRLNRLRPNTRSRALDSSTPMSSRQQQVADGTIERRRGRERLLFACALAIVVFSPADWLSPLGFSWGAVRHPAGVGGGAGRDRAWAASRGRAADARAAQPAGDRDGGAVRGAGPADGRRGEPAVSVERRHAGDRRAGRAGPRQRGRRLRGRRCSRAASPSWASTPRRRWRSRNGRCR